MVTSETRPVPLRSQIAPEHTWDAASVFASDADWEQAIASLSAAIADAARFLGHLADGPSTLADWLTLRDDLWARMGRIYIYASMFFEVDTADTEAAAKRDRALGLFAQLAAAVSFTDPELLARGTRLRVFATLRHLPA